MAQLGADQGIMAGVECIPSSIGAATLATLLYLF